MQPQKCASPLNSTPLASHLPHLSAGLDLEVRRHSGNGGGWRGQERSAGWCAAVRVVAETRPCCRSTQPQRDEGWTLLRASGPQEPHSVNGCACVCDGLAAALPPPWSEAAPSPLRPRQLRNNLRAGSTSYLSLYSQGPAEYWTCDTCSLDVE